MASPVMGGSVGMEPSRIYLRRRGGGSINLSGAGSRDRMGKSLCHSRENLGVPRGQSGAWMRAL